MKNIKKLLALVLALAICAAFALPALATADEAGKPASEGPFELTLNNPQVGHTYEIYQLFTGDPAKDGENWILANVQYGSSGWKMEGMKDDAAGAAEAISGYSSALITSPFSIVKVTTGFCAILFLPFCLVI